MGRPRPKPVTFHFVPFHSAGLPGRVKRDPDGLRCRDSVLLGAAGNRAGVCNGKPSTYQPHAQGNRYMFGKIQPLKRLATRIMYLTANNYRREGIALIQPINWLATRTMYLTAQTCRRHGIMVASHFNGWVMGVNTIFYQCRRYWILTQVRWYWGERMPGARTRTRRAAKRPEGARLPVAN